MLTGFQAEVIAYMTDGGFICASHVEEQFPEVSERVDNTYWDDIADLQELSGFEAYSRYALDEQFPEGLYCDRCTTELIEPAEDYCTTHDAWYSGTGQDDLGAEFRYCEDADPSEVENGTDNCEFPDTDPNPPRVRWVPCGICGARDGERCDLTKHGGMKCIHGVDLGSQCDECGDEPNAHS